MGLCVSTCWGSGRASLLFWGWPEGITGLQQGHNNKALQGENKMVKQLPKLKGRSKRKADCLPHAAKFSFAYAIKRPCSSFKFHHQL